MTPRTQSDSRCDPLALYRIFELSPTCRLRPDDFAAGGAAAGCRWAAANGGFLLEIGAARPDAARLRPALAVLDHAPLLPSDVLALVQWAHRYYHHPPGDAFAAALPVLLRQGESAALPSCLRCIASLAQARRRWPTRLHCVASPPSGAVLAELARCPAGLDTETLRPLARAAALRALCAKGWVESCTAEASSAGNCSSFPGLAAPPILSTAQATAITAVSAALDQFQVFLLEGVTGSGKTEVYLRLIEAVLARRQQALVLTRKSA